MNEYIKDFPMLNKDIVYLNNASTTFKPKQVVEEIQKYYYEYGVNTNRGVDSLGFKVTSMFEGVRKKISEFINSEQKEVIFTRGTTEGLNLVALSLGDMIIKEGNEIIVSVFEHHSNFIPWQELCKRKNAKLVIVETEKDGTVNPLKLESLMNKKVKIVALNHTSNVFGSTNDLKKLSEIVHKYNSYFVVDGAQGIVHNEIDVKEMDIDFYAFSAHKLYGPMGVGVLFGKYEILSIMKPIIFGGEMIDIVTTKTSSYKNPPYCFEAGTMMVPEVLGIGAAIDYFKNIGYKKINEHIKELRNYLVNRMINEIDNITIYNKDIVNSSLITFNINGIHSHDIASLLDKENIIVRAGHHCAEPLMNYLEVPATIRISFALYNTINDCDKVIEALKKARDYLNVIL